jgi:hypothetical protein
MPGGQGIYDNTDEPDEGDGATPQAGGDVDTDKETPDVTTPDDGEAEPTD